MKRDVTQALRNRLKRVTAERNTLQTIAGQACLRIAGMELLVAELRAAIELGQINCDEVYDDLRAELDALKKELENRTTWKN